MTPGARPVVLLTPDLMHADGGEPQYLVRTHYAAAVMAAGGTPVIAPLEPDLIGPLLAMADGIVLTGSSPGVEVAPARSAFERQLVAQALRIGLPLLGICHGMQLLGECLGGRVLRDLPDLHRPVTLHMPGPVPDHVAHAIYILPDSLLARCAGPDPVPGPVAVNSLHRHVLEAGGRVRVVACAPDGVVEAIEATGDGFCLGVQWHPEYGLTEFDRRLVSAFVTACGNGLR